MTYSGKHRKPGLFRKNRTNPGEPVKWNRLGQIPKKLGQWHETDKFVQFVPRHTKEYELPDYCPN